METRREIEEELTQHFEGILSEYRSERGQDIAINTQLIPKIITKENNEMLLKPISMQEVEEAVK